MQIICAIAARKIIDLMEERLFGKTNVQFVKIAVGYLSLRWQSKKNCQQGGKLQHFLILNIKILRKDIFLKIHAKFHDASSFFENI